MISSEKYTPFQYTYSIHLFNTLIQYNYSIHFNTTLTIFNTKNKKQYVTLRTYPWQYDQLKSYST